MILTLWNDVAESEGNVIDNCQETQPIISATALAVSPHYGNSFYQTIDFHHLLSIHIFILISILIIYPRLFLVKLY